jgi:hypothetical protein
MSVIPALLMVAACEIRSAMVRVVNVTLRLALMPCGADALQNFHGTEIERDHQRQQQGKFDGGHTALIARQMDESTAENLREHHDSLHDTAR